MAFREGGEQPKPLDLGDVFKAIDIEVSELHVTWQVYHQLFDGTNERDQMWREADAVGAEVIHNCIANELVLHLSRLTDPASQGRFGNLSLERLIETLPSVVDDEFCRSLHEQLVEIRSAAETIRSHRSKRIAHADLDHAMGALKIASLTLPILEKVMKLIRDFVNGINLRYLHSETVYEHVVLQDGGGDGIVWHIERGLKLDRLERQVLLGEMTLEDAWKDLRGF